MSKKTSHEFALFSDELTESIISKKQTIVITEVTLLHRLQQVLRLSVGSTIMLFDNQQHALSTVTTITKKQITLSFNKVEKNVQVVPELIVLVPLLKREALDELIYSCRELGVSGIYLIATEKCSRFSITDQEWERLERVSNSAAEQSKNFAPCPFLNKDKKILTLKTLLTEETFKSVSQQAITLFASPEGASLSSLLPQLESKRPYILSFGPEGDLTTEEKMLLKAHGFTFVKLGSTVLRAQQAGTLLIGFIRSIV